APPPPDKKGRRGNWWDAKHDKDKDEEPEPEPDPDDLPGGTAMVQRPVVEPEPEPEPPPPEPEPEPQLEPYRPLPADDYQGHLTAEEPAWKVWTRRAVWSGALLAILGVVAVIAGYVYISREIPTFDSIRDYHPFVASKVVASDGSVIR